MFFLEFVQYPDRALRINFWKAVFSLDCRAVNDKPSELRRMAVIESDHQWFFSRRNVNMGFVEQLFYAYEPKSKIVKSLQVFPEIIRGPYPGAVLVFDPVVLGHKDLAQLVIDVRIS